MRKTKIVCTLGPATDSKEVLRELMLAGMNVARINFSHGNYQDQEERINRFKEVREELSLPIPMLLDTQGPEIRIGKFENGKIELIEGELFSLIQEDMLGDETKVTVAYKNLCDDVKIGNMILVNDGLIELQVEEINNRDIVCRVLHGGILTDRKSANVPDLKLNLPSITEKDIEDITYGIAKGFDYIAASFIRKVEDVEAIRNVLREHGGEHIKIIAKIENREGVDNFEEILKVSDGIMVARGDLGVEVPVEEVPILQKQFIKKTYRQGKPVITATQMLESMIDNQKPTRAEVSDVANSVYDGTSGIMLSGETATGKYPTECVRVMNKVAISIENAIHYWKRFNRRKYDVQDFDCKFNMNYAVNVTATNTNAKAIIAYTDTGNTARILSSFVPGCPIFAITPNEITYRQLGLCWNVTPKLIQNQSTINDLIKVAIEDLKNEGFLQAGDLVVIAGGDAIVQDIETSDDELNRVMGGLIKI